MTALPSFRTEAEAPRVQKLGGTVAENLERFFCNYESEVGFRSSFGSMLNALNGLSTHDVIDQDLNAIARVSDGQLRKVWRTLNLLNERGDRPTILVLYRMYGPFSLAPIPDKKKKEENGEPTYPGPLTISGSYREAFGDDVARIAVMTHAAQIMREELAYHRSSIRVDAVNANIESIPERASLDFWRHAKHCAALMQLYKSMTGPFSEAQVDDRKAMRAEYNTARRAMVKAMQQEQPEPFAAVISAIGAADKETSVEEAIRHALRSKDRDAFVKQVKAEGHAIREEAREAYLMARRELSYG